ncbi:MltR family transcriptional regulator [Vibrio splendidus]
MNKIVFFMLPFLVVLYEIIVITEIQSTFIFRMYDYTSKQSQALLFDDDMVYDFISNQSNLSKGEDSFYLDSINQLKLSPFDSFTQTRYESLIKTVLKLCCENLLESIEKEILG